MSKGNLNSHDYSNQFIVSDEAMQHAGMTNECQTEMVYSKVENQFSEERKSKMKLKAREMFDLGRVCEVPNEHGRYEVREIYDEGFEDFIDNEKFEETLDKLAKHIYGEGAHWHDAQEKFDPYYGKICIDLVLDKRLEIEDITDKIRTDTGCGIRFIILVNRELTEYQWIVVTFKTIYS